MDATTYTGNGATQSVVNQAQFKPDLVWYKSRSSGVYNHGLFDSIRGTTKQLFSNTTGAEDTYSGVTAFNSNGFSLGSDAGGNANGGSYVGWQWQAGQGSNTTNTTGTITSTVSANTTAGFSIATYTGNSSSGATVGHGLGVAPSFMLVKCRSNAGTYWIAYQATLGGTKGLYLNTNDSVVTNSILWNNTAPTSSVLTLGNSSDVNNSGYTYVAYCWSAVAGFSQFGSYTGNGSADGPFIYTGFRPKFLMYKRTDSAGSWFMVDSSRNTYNVANYWLQANTTDAEQTDGAIDLLSNGYKIRGTGTGTNANGGSYIYCAWAENPFKYANAR
jgi:hypothetical protein